ncbi:MAG: ATP-binding protein [Bryobacterales bacterium]|nr:ATP-binding protein [Bryobacterales bacterium]
MRKFNRTGPVFAERHYCIPPLNRVNLDEILELIAGMEYFVLHAPRQTGKTSILLALQDRLNAEGKYRCLYVNVEGGQAAKEDTARAMRALLGQVASRSRDILQDDFVDRMRSEYLEKEGPDGALSEMLVRWSAAHPQPLVLLIDEIDTLVGDTLISVLRQLRANYDRRPHQFPQSVVLCGVRDVRDYRIYSSREGTHIKGGSAFNIKAESLRLGDFSEAELRELLAQHTAERCQAFEAGVIEHIWALTRGQPWLVNALAYEACFRAEPGRDRSRPIRVEAIDEAREQLILRRVTHLDQLANTLSEERVRRVIEPLLAGTVPFGDPAQEDLDYASDLGLIRCNGAVEIANPIYREVIPRQLTYSRERYIPERTEWYVDAAGQLDLAKLLEAFQGYFRENVEHWVEHFEYKEAGPQLLLQAYLHRIVNGGGRVEREYGLGRGRTDLLVLWPQGGQWDPAHVTKHVIECKVVRPGQGRESVVRSGLEQTSWYMDRCGAESGHLVIFDRRPGQSWEERVFRKDPGSGESPITVWGL